MNYSLGCAFKFDEIILNFPYKKLQFTCKDSSSIINNNHRSLLIRKIFMFNFKKVILDIINNNITFILPLNGSKSANIHMRRVTGEQFKKLRKSGKWADVDFISSLFSGYQMTLYLLGKRTERTKSLYLNKELRDIIIKNTNNGMSYGDGKTDKTINDYFEETYNAFPTISKDDIKRILKYCWKSIYLHNSYGGDVVLSDSEIWCYMGNLKKDPLQHFKYYIKKLAVRIRVLYIRKKIPWDGYYYFALNREQQLLYLDLKNSRGRPKKRFKYGTVMLYKIYDECKICLNNNCYIFRIPYGIDLGMKRLVYDLISDKAELIKIREPMKFKDILVDNNEYDFI